MRLCSALALVWFAVSGAVAAEPLTLLTENNPPYNFMDSEQQRVIGIAADVVHEMTARAGVTTQVQLLPWQRAFQAALDQPNACIFATTVTAEREKQFHFIEPIAGGGIVLWGRADWSRPVTSLADVRDVTIGVVAGDVGERFLIERGHTLRDQVAESALNARKLAAKRIDLWIAGRTGGPWIAKLQGVGPFKLVLDLSETRLGLACNRAIDPSTLERLRDAHAAMVADGTLGLIHSRYR
jgi:polar amino acid transport system substrate-binding protein